METSKLELIYREISSLSDSDKAVLLGKLANDLTRNRRRKQGVDFYDIRGVGKEIWQGIDAQEYVDKERDSWE